MDDADDDDEALALAQALAMSNILPEPAADAPAESVCTVIVRRADGSRIQRRFPADATFQQLFETLRASYEQLAQLSQLESQHPRRHLRIGVDESETTTLQAAGFMPNVVLNEVA